MPPKRRPPPSPKPAPEKRLARGRAKAGALFPASAPVGEMPASYGSTLDEIKQRVRDARLRTVLAANAAMVLAYWEIGQVILRRQQSEGWGCQGH